MTIFLLVVVVFIVLFVLSRRDTGGVVNWKEVKKNAKFYNQTPNGMWRLGVIVSERRLFLKMGRREEKEYSFDDVRSITTSRDGKTFYVNMKDIDLPEWSFPLGYKNTARWSEIFRQYIYEGKE